MKLFQYAAIYCPKKHNQKEVHKPKIIVPVTECLAVDEKSATLIAARAIPEDYVDKLEEVEVVVRPF